MVGDLGGSMYGGAGGARMGSSQRVDVALWRGARFMGGVWDRKGSARNDKPVVGRGVGERFTSRAAKFGRKRERDTAADRGR
jgi:hypothetical protein